uniref:Tumor protein D52 n=1 Tax=Aceria tosichella TaxID=561515 RepID=A0A6G1SFG8_9ACAR
MENLDNPVLESKGSMDESNSSFDLESMDPEQRQRVEEELKTELAKTEEEIQTLRQVLAARIKHSQDLKRKLGIGVWKELTNDLQQGIKNVQETTASGLGLFNTPYQKTSETVKFAAEKTTDIFGSLGDSIGKKLVDVKNSSAFKSFEERVGSTIGRSGLASTSSNNNNNNNNNSNNTPTVNEAPNE